MSRTHSAASDAEDAQQALKALDDGKKVQAKVTVRATDAAGNVATAKRAIKIVSRNDPGARGFQSEWRPPRLGGLLITGAEATTPLEAAGLWDQFLEAGCRLTA